MVRLCLLFSLSLAYEICIARGVFFFFSSFFYVSTIEELEPSYLLILSLLSVAYHGLIRFRRDVS